VRLSGFMACNDKLSARYDGGTLHLGFTVRTKTAATLHAWLGVPGPPVRTAPLWSVPIAASDPAVFGEVALPGFPHIGNLFVLTALTSDGGPVCADWSLVDTGH